MSEQTGTVTRLGRVGRALLRLRLLFTPASLLSIEARAALALWNVEAILERRILELERQERALERRARNRDAGYLASIRVATVAGALAELRGIRTTLEHNARAYGRPSPAPTRESE